MGLDAAGNTTAAIGKGFAIGSAAFVSLALYGAFITRSKTNPYGVKPEDAFVITDVQVTDALLFSGLLIGAMLPYAFSAMTMKSVGKAALEMVFEIRKQLTDNPKIRTGEQLPDYERCVAISTSASLKEMVGPGALDIITPLVVGLVFGPRAVAGLLPGALVSGVQMAISSSNTGGAWDNAKKYIEAGKLKDGDVIKKKGSDEHKAAVIGDTVGDPLKDTSGPSLTFWSSSPLFCPWSSPPSSKPLVSWSAPSAKTPIPLKDSRPAPIDRAITSILSILRKTKRNDFISRFTKI